MAALSTLDANARRALCTELEARAGVRRVVVDEEAETVWIICEPEAPRAQLEGAARAALSALGIESSEVPVEVAVHGEGPARRRVRFERTDRSAEPDGRQRVRVVLEWHGTNHTGEAVGEAGGLIEMRTAATAALLALERVTGGTLGLRLTGVKQVRAFDADLVVASLTSFTTPPQHFVGTALAASDTLRAAVLAVLNALNRKLGNYLATID
ncbi:MAG: hypothetical protein HY561_08565 [Gemmatimonadetes bacterium]|nr:hypothetical protein [Gemmatimonadota bacterium]